MIDKCFLSVGVYKLHTSHLLHVHRKKQILYSVMYIPALYIDSSVYKISNQQKSTQYNRIA